MATLAGDMALLGLFSSLLVAGTQKASLVGPSLFYLLAYQTLKGPSGNYGPTHHMVQLKKKKAKNASNKDRSSKSPGLTTYKWGN